LVAHCRHSFRPAGSRQWLHQRSLTDTDCSPVPDVGWIADALTNTQTHVHSYPASDTNPDTNTKTHERHSSANPTESHGSSDALTDSNAVAYDHTHT
jgi:hypothetical protein